VANERAGFRHRLQSSRRLAEEPDAEALQRSAAALAIWQASQATQGSPVGTYLRSRGLDLPVPPVLRSHAGLKHPSGGVWPAMVWRS
jgi:putative DNA primase/helicase